MKNITRPLKEPRYDRVYENGVNWLDTIGVSKEINMPTVISVEHDKIWDTTYITITYSDKSKQVIEIEEGAERGEEMTFVDVE